MKGALARQGEEMRSEGGVVVPSDVLDIISEASLKRLIELL